MYLKPGSHLSPNRVFLFEKGMRPGGFIFMNKAGPVYFGGGSAWVVFYKSSSLAFPRLCFGLRRSDMVFRFVVNGLFGHAQNLLPIKANGPFTDVMPD